MKGWGTGRLGGIGQHATDGRAVPREDRDGGLVGAAHLRAAVVLYVGSENEQVGRAPRTVGDRGRCHNRLVLALV